MTDREITRGKVTSHGTFRGWLSLAVAGALEPKEQAELDRHLAGCEECTTELERWRVLAGDLKRLPTPQPSPMLVQRVRARLDEAAVERAEKQRSRATLVSLVLFSWAMTLASWPLVRLASHGMANLLDVSVRTAWMDLVWYTVLTWLTGGVAAVVLAWQKRHERRFA